MTSKRPLDSARGERGWRFLVLVVPCLLAGCRLYDPQPLDCRILCRADGACPVDTTCREGFCRTPGSRGRCECRAGDERPCGTDVGACQPGVQRCAVTEWGACEGSIVPTEERCNGLDDDCDGVIDEDVALPPPCARMFGVCVNTRQHCLDGAFVACDDQTYGPDFEAEEVSCDGLDNDCDGLVDSHAIVQLAPETRGPWLFLTTTRGFALISSTEARWLSRTLEPEAVVALDAGDFVAASRGDTLLLAERSDGGVVLTALERDGGSSTRTLPTWRSPATLDLAAEVAAASVNGEVQLVSLSDGGAPVSLGSDTDGTLRLSQTGETLAWSGGLTRTTDLSLLRTGNPGPLLALLDLESNIIAGVPAAQPAQPTFLPDLLAGSPARTLTAFPVPALSGVQATEHQGRVLLVGVEGANAMWVVNERGTQRRVIGAGLDSVRVTPSHEVMAALAWKQGGAVWGVRRCAP